MIVDVVIPTVTGREDSLERCIESYKRYTPPSALNLIIVKDEETVGEAWIKGMEQARAAYLHLSADDLEITSWQWLKACAMRVNWLQIPSPIVYRPNGTIESCGGDMNAPACLISEIQPDGTEVDFAPVPFGSRAMADEIGMLPIHYGSDVWWSHRGRQLGYPSVVTYGFEFIHHRSDVKRRGAHPGEMAELTKALGQYE